MEVYVFDAYGTLFDVHAAARRYAERIGPNAARLSDVWRTKQLEYTWVRTLMDRYRDFWDITADALDTAIAVAAPEAKAYREDLMQAYRELDAYPEVKDTLAGLKQNAATAILSNGSQAMLQTAVRSAGLEDLIDAVLSVDEIGVFKTAPKVYDLVGARFVSSPGNVSFQSSNRWDIAGATAYGFRTVWINRTGQPDEYADLPPVRVLDSLEGLAAV